ncbi:DUF2799 domain-containing protein [Vibrio amylolyticus]|uniref:DUF2799 domain-containing protein n=1 Tax=Vibrio amylolyticus TaxID=2847292 RepID=UPI00354C0D4C
MKYLFLLIALFAVGCAQVSTPTSMAANDWAEYGKQRGLEGHWQDSQDRLTKQDLNGVLSDELYMAYEQGYGDGKTEYCSQDARMLGVAGKPYRGICDDVDVWFRQDYNAGLESGNIF